jgi:protein-tyrosine phosphatase
VTLEHQARQFRAADFARFDLIVAMDLSNLRNLERIAPDAAARQRIALLRSFDAGAPPGAEVPDPYAGGVEGFDEVFAICLRACTGLLDHLATRA